MRPPVLRASFEDMREEMVVDLFAGGGGASTGIEAALTRSPDIAINHSPEAIAMHTANHPSTRHFIEDVWKVPPRDVCGSRRVGLLWMSPDCTHHSRAKGTKPLSTKRRALAYAGIRWAREVRPRVVVGENVQEFEDWGPLNELGRPDPTKKGRSFLAWIAKWRSYGYDVEWRVLVAADYGAPTTRERLYFVARCDGEPIIWPEPSHGPGRGAAWLPAASIIRWDILGRSIFDRDKPLVEASLRRIAVGLERYVLGAADPFIVKYYGTGAVADVTDPLDTITSRDRFGLVAPFIIRHGHYSKITGAGLREGCGAGTFRGQRATAPVATICYDRYNNYPSTQRNVTRHQRELHDLCPGCGGPMTGGVEFNRCNDCRETGRLKAKQLRDERRVKGLCGCGKKAVAGKSKCKRCRCAARRKPEEDDTAPARAQEGTV